MSARKGIIALMGSGELTATMVEVHKELLAGLAKPRRAVFLDTPAGFQLNVDQLSRKAIEYFRAHVQHPMSTASFKSSATTTSFDAERAFHALRQANFILIGPGSPSYAVRQWLQTPIPEILINQVRNGGCLVAASAAALTVGRFTIPVYEIYKVGEELYWIDGINILEQFNFNMVVIPHWNNAEGGTHDTRFCYMGEPRFKKLESLLPKDVTVFGLDEHTACLMDLEKNEAVIKGIGCVTLRRDETEMVFDTGDRFSLDLLRSGDVGKAWKERTPEPIPSAPTFETAEISFWNRVHAIRANFHGDLDKHEPRDATNAILELDRTIWQAQQNLENEEFIAQARDILREMIVLLGTRLAISPTDRVECLAPLVDDLLELREAFRRKKQWDEADAVRECLERAEITIEDTREGPKWGLKQ